MTIGFGLEHVSQSFLFRVEGAILPMIRRVRGDERDQDDADEGQNRRCVVRSRGADDGGRADDGDPCRDDGDLTE